ncbi:MAG: hypothetical protein U1F49_15005 [Rubrivivax sp.]
MSPSKNPQAIVELARAWPEMLFVLCGPNGDDSRRLRASVNLPNVQFHLGIDEAQKAWACAHCAGFLFLRSPKASACRRSKPCTSARRSSSHAAHEPARDRRRHHALLRRLRRCRCAASSKRPTSRGRASRATPGAIRRHAARFGWDRAGAEYLALYARLLRLQCSGGRDGAVPGAGADAAAAAPG